MYVNQLCSSRKLAEGRVSICEVTLRAGTHTHGLLPTIALTASMYIMHERYKSIASVEIVTKLDYAGCLIEVERRTLKRKVDKPWTLLMFRVRHAKGMLN